LINSYNKIVGLYHLFNVRKVISAGCPILNFYLRVIASIYHDNCILK